ncbi:hypothetical protein CGMCC3_g1722 [Colletotrichum fructicola]|nr:uncharacterized protein CGMCC3_g1722 [Colletotrichum fructicola]KAE9582579.1 hypothetical protein CGMCC3_g1722 [Colletotrichum fructicola]
MSILALVTPACERYWTEHRFSVCPTITVQGYGTVKNIADQVIGVIDDKRMIAVLWFIAFRSTYDRAPDMKDTELEQ